MYRVLLAEVDKNLAEEGDASAATSGGNGGEDRQRAMAAELERLRVEGREQMRALQEELEVARREVTAAKIAKAQTDSDLSYLKER